MVLVPRISPIDCPGNNDVLSPVYPTPPFTCRTTGWGNCTYVVVAGTDCHDILYRVEYLHRTIHRTRMEPRPRSTMLTSIPYCGIQSLLSKVLQGLLLGKLFVLPFSFLCLLVLFSLVTDLQTIENSSLTNLTQPDYFRVGVQKLKRGEN